MTPLVDKNLDIQNREMAISHKGLTTFFSLTVESRSLITRLTKAVIDQKFDTKREPEVLEAQEAQEALEVLEVLEPVDMADKEAPEDPDPREVMAQEDKMDTVVETKLEVAVKVATLPVVKVDTLPPVVKVDTALVVKVDHLMEEVLLQEVEMAIHQEVKVVIVREVRMDIRREGKVVDKVATAPTEDTAAEVQTDHNRTKEDTPLLIVTTFRPMAKIHSVRVLDRTVTHLAGDRHQEEVKAEEMEVTLQEVLPEVLAQVLFQMRATSINSWITFVLLAIDCDLSRMRRSEMMLTLP